MTHERILIVGGGLTGCTLAHRFAQHGIESVIVERDDHVGGLVRSDHMNGVLYEPHGSHIFHTEDQEVWELANSITPFNDYRHRVDIMIEGKRLNWPILLSDVEAQTKSAEILAELDARKDVVPAERAGADNFETWCLDLMGPTLYERYIKPYTEKQWGRPARELSASWAPSRVSVRWDNDPYLFPDRFQGWPAGPNGYTDLLDGLISSPLITTKLGLDVTFAGLPKLMQDVDATRAVITAPLDVFCDASLGLLEWRGILVRSVHIPHVEFAQSAMVVNYPALEYPFVRIHETKHASGQVCEGTVLGFEFTNAPTRYYPIDSPENRQLNDRYQSLIAEAIPATSFAGRLANYVYIDMDDCMREALDEADRIVDQLL